MTVFAQPRGLTAATALPVRFAQVRDDAAGHLRLAHHQRAVTGAPIRVLAVASGGCTAAALAASGLVEALHVVDPNPAQLALTRLKVHLLTVADYETRSAILGHRDLAPALRAAALTAMFSALRLPANVLGPPALVAFAGPDNVGRYEQRFAAVRRLLPAAEVAAALALTDPAEQSRRVAPGTILGHALETACERVLGTAALADGVRRAFAAGPAAANPYAWQLLAGQGGPSVPWLDAPVAAQPCPVGWIPSTVTETLRAARPGQYDLIDLSGSLDTLAPDAAACALRLAHAALRPGGVVVTRRVAASAEGFEWGAVTGRSVLPGELHVGVAA